MKNVGIALLLLLLVTSCLPEKIGKKDRDPDIAGVYQITSFRSNGQELTQMGLSGTINVTKKNESLISISLTTTANGKTSTTDVGEAAISKSSGDTYDMLENNVRIGTIDGTTFSLNATSSSGPVSLVGKK
jgi:hypothetical protein